MYFNPESATPGMVTILQGTSDQVWREQIVAKERLVQGATRAYWSRKYTTKPIEPFQ